MRTPAIAYAVEGRVREFAEVTDLDGKAKEVLEKKLAPEAQSIVHRLTLSLRVALPKPDDPECCGYRDFSKGIAELAFRDPGGRSLLDVAFMEGRQKYYAVHAQASAGFGAWSLRTDPGFMSMLNHGSPDGSDEPMISPFYRHGIFSDSKRMAFLTRELGKTGRFGEPNNEDYEWRNEVADSGLELAGKVVATASGEPVLLVGHSQGGLVCRMAAIALAGTYLGTCGQLTTRILRWQRQHRVPKATPMKLAVVTIATPNAGGMTFGQMSVTAELSGRAIMATANRGGFHNLKDLTTPRLFQEFEKWQVDAR